MLAFVADLHEVGARTNGVGQCGLFVQLLAHLVEVGNVHGGAALYAAAIGFQLAQDEFEQGSFAHAIGAQQANAVATQYACAKAIDQCAIAVGFYYILQLGHQLA